MSSSVTNTLKVVTSYLQGTMTDCVVERTYRPTYLFDHAKPDDPVKIIVSPFDRMAYRQDRSNALKSTLVVDISVLKKLRTIDNESVDPLVDIVSNAFDLLSKCVGKVLESEGVSYRIEEVEHGDNREICFEEFLYGSLFLGAMQARVSVDVT